MSGLVIHFMKNLFAYLRNAYSEIFKGIIFLLTVAAIVYMLPRKVKFFYEYQEGRPWTYETLIAEKDIPLLKTKEEIETEKQGIRRSVAPYFKYNSALSPIIEKKGRDAFDSLWLNRYGLSNDVDYQKVWDSFQKNLLFIIDQGIVGKIPSDYPLSDDDVITLVKDKEAERIMLVDLFVQKSFVQ